MRGGRTPPGQPLPAQIWKPRLGTREWHGQGHPGKTRTRREGNCAARMCSVPCTEQAPETALDGGWGWRRGLGGRWTRTQLLPLASMLTLAPIPRPTFRWSPWDLLPGPKEHVHCAELGMWGQPHHRGYLPAPHPLSLRLSLLLLGDDLRLRGQTILSLKRQAGARTPRAPGQVCSPGPLSETVSSLVK